MNKFTISIDSSCDICKEYLDKKNVNLLYLDVIKDGVVIDNNISNKEIYDDIRKGAIYKTSQTNPERYYDYFTNILETTKLPIVHISLCEALSNTINNAITAKNLIKKETNQDIYIVDSKIASLGLMLLLDKAIELRDKGEEPNKCKDVLDDLANHINTYYTTDNLSYFFRGGRLSKAKTIISSIFNINPVLYCEPDGKLSVYSCVSGKMRAQMKIINLIENNVIDPGEQTLYVTSADNQEEAIKFIDRILKVIPFKDYKYMDMGPVIGSHTGPGLLAVFFVGKKRKIKS